MKEAIIYKIVNSKNKKIYIGSTTNFSRRKNQHFSSLKSNNHHSIALQRAYNKYGKECFCMEKIERFSYNVLEDILFKEQYYIDNFKPEYNIAKIAGSQLGLKRSEQAKLNMSNGQKGRLVWNTGLKLGPLSYSVRKKMSITQKKVQQKFYKKVKQYDLSNKLIKEFKSITYCAKKLKLSVSNISACMNGRRKTTGGFMFKYS